MKNYFLLLSLLFLFSCASDEDVMPNSNGINKLTTTGISKESARSYAIKGAKKFCERKKQTTSFIKETTTYIGDMNEKMRNTLCKTSQTVSMVSGPLSKEQKAGNAGQNMTCGEDYQTDVEFSCN